MIALARLGLDTASASDDNRALHERDVEDLRRELMQKQEA